MALYSTQNPFETAMQSVTKAQNALEGTQGTTTTTTGPKQSLDKGTGGLLTGLSMFNLMGRGNTAGGVTGALTSPGGQFTGALAGKAGEKADSPWEAFIGGAFSGVKSMPISPMPQTVEEGFIGGGLSGMAGYLLR